MSSISTTSTKKSRKPIRAPWKCPNSLAQQSEYDCDRNITSHNHEYCTIHKWWNTCSIPETILFIIFHKSDPKVNRDVELIRAINPSMHIPLIETIFNETEDKKNDDVMSKISFGVIQKIANNNLFWQWLFLGSCDPKVCELLLLKAKCIEPDFLLDSFEGMDYDNESDDYIYFSEWKLKLVTDLRDCKLKA